MNNRYLYIFHIHLWIFKNILFAFTFIIVYCIAAMYQNLLLFYILIYTDFYRKETIYIFIHSIYLAGQLRLKILFFK